MEDTRQPDSCDGSFAPAIKQLEWFALTIPPPLIYNAEYRILVGLSNLINQYLTVFLQFYPYIFENTFVVALTLALCENVFPFLQVVPTLRQFSMDFGPEFAAAVSQLDAGQQQKLAAALA
jgi:hypothetical protein